MDDDANNPQKVMQGGDQKQQDEMDRHMQGGDATDKGQSGGNQPMNGGNDGGDPVENGGTEENESGINSGA